MIKKALLGTTLLLAVAFTTHAQGGGFRRTVEERVQLVHHKIDSAFKPEAATLKKIDETFTRFYTDQDKVLQELMGGGDRPDEQARREKMQPIMDARDKELKTLLTEDQFKKFKDEIEPSMRPQRQGGPGPRRNQ